MKRAAVLLACTAAACDPLAQASYLGEPLVTLRGEAISRGALPPLEAAMLWQRGPPPSNDQQDLATRAPVQAGFPATFTLHLYQPPPAAARRTLAAGEVSYARANAAAVPYGIAANDVGPAAAASNPGYGIDPNHWVLHLAEGVQPGSLMEWWLGTALPAGFHLLRVAAVNPACVTSAALAACLADLGRRGVTDPAFARSLCLEPFKLSLAPPDEVLVLDLGTLGLGPAGGACP